MRFEGHADHEEEPAEPEQRGSGHRRFSLPGAMVHPELRYHSEIQEPVIQAPPVVDPSIATHPNRHGRVVPGTVPHVSSRSVNKRGIFLSRVEKSQGKSTLSLTAALLTADTNT